MRNQFQPNTTKNMKTKRNHASFKKICTQKVGINYFYHNNNNKKNTILSKRPNLTITLYAKG